jgi:HTH-type transcriptional regulator/antitoxin HigA
VQAQPATLPTGAIMKTIHKPFINIGPGEFIQDEIDERGWSQKEFAEILGFSKKHVNRLIQNKEPITSDTARRLSKAFGSSAKFWLDLETTYRLNLETKAKTEEEDCAARALCFHYMPIREMRKKGWLPSEENNLIKAVKSFWNISNLSFDFLREESQTCYRKSEASANFNQYAAFVWLQKVKNDISTKVAPSYSQDKLEKLAKQIPNLSYDKQGIEKFINNLNECGVYFLHLQHLEDTYIDGAAFYYKENPVIVYTARYDRADNFWFTMTHEIIHVLKHISKDGQPIFDNMEEPSSNEIAKEADRLSSQILKEEEILNFFENKARISAIQINQCSEELKISPAIIVGCLHHHKILSFRSMRKFLLPIKDTLKLGEQN